MDETTLSTKAEHWLADAASSAATIGLEATDDQYMGTQLYTNEFSRYNLLSKLDDI